jgi:hypothetical protein
MRLPRVGTCWTVLAVTLLALLARAGCHDVSQAWDSGYYHLPFAARLGGITSASEYVFNRDNQARFAGFPLLGELLQGLLWRALARPQGANFVGWAAIPLCAWGITHAASARFETSGTRAPWGMIVTGLVGIPLVMIHATSAYVDLPASCALATAFVRLTLLSDERVRRMRELILLTALLATSTSMRLQHLPIALLILSLLATRVWPRRSLLAALIVASPVVFWVPLRNMLVHGNPVYPVELTILGHALPFVDTRYASSPVWLAHVPQPIRFLCSMLELGLPPLTEAARYSVDQWTPPQHAGYRMGGSSGLGVLCAVVLVICALRRAQWPKRETTYLLLLLVCTACMPQSHELRYTLYAPLALVALAIVYSFALWPRLASAFALGLIASTLLITRGAWMVPSGSTLPDMLAAKVDTQQIATTPEGGVLCAEHAPRNWLYTASFHGRHYRVVEADASGLCSESLERATARTTSSKRP